MNDKQFNFFEAKISSDEIIKSINSQANNIQVIMVLQQNFIYNFQTN